MLANFLQIILMIPLCLLLIGDVSQTENQSRGRGGVQVGSVCILNPFSFIPIRGLVTK